MKKQFRIKSILTSVLLVVLLIITIYMIIANFVVGPYNKINSDTDEMIDKINKNKTCQEVKRHSFKYVTYTCTSKNKYIIYDVKGKELLERSKKDANFKQVEQLIKDQYPSFKDVKIEIAYGINSIAYVLEKDNHFLIIDFDELKVVFNSGE